MQKAKTTIVITGNNKIFLFVFMLFIYLDFKLYPQLGHIFAESDISFWHSGHLISDILYTPIFIITPLYNF